MNFYRHSSFVRRTMEFLFPVAILVLWVVLQAWVLPRFGVKT
jgi:hypothetical protein